jgi:Macrocin-O-methyltransferase (TylF)/Coenzyme PQQ synthesis protein D (PqqD)
MVVVRREGVHVAREGDHAFLVRPAARSRYRLSPVGATIVEALAAPRTVASVCELVTARYEVAPEQCETEVAGFVRELELAGAIEIREDARADTELRRRYLDVLKRALVNLIYPEDALRLELALSGELSGGTLEDQRLLRDVRRRKPDAYREVVATKAEGRLDPLLGGRLAHTLVGISGLDNLERCAFRVFADGIPGDFLEAGVCHGGASIFMRALQVAYGEEERTTWLADSFAGVPPPSHALDGGLDLTEERLPWMASDLESVRANVGTYDLLSDRVRFLPGLFEETLRSAPVEELAILRVDADLYSSTRTVLDELYDRLAPGGFVIVDDYGCLEPCRRAVDEFVARRGLDVEMHRVDWTRVCWRKGL